MHTPIDDIIESFSYLEDWEERYRYLIELGQALADFPDDARTRENKVEGCTSQVWLKTAVEQTPDGPVLQFTGDSDSHLVRGLVTVVMALYSGRPAQEILALDAAPVLEKLGLREHLTPQRSNGLRSMIKRINVEAQEALATS
ncbi:SufE family protein [Terrihabitans sp. B22-R8]|uniref:SufE family protein n=1 Tax=Terrihabitans sp. B22-R8 TaxID=3425128 RepID=UPI00403C83D5